MKKFLFITAYLISNIAIASDETIENNYKSNYIKQMEPIVLDNFIQNIPEASKKELEKLAASFVVKMSECQYKSVNHYPKKYWEHAITPISEGVDIYENNESFEAMLADDLEQGLISEQEIVDMVGRAEENVQSCLNS